MPALFWNQRFGAHALAGEGEHEGEREVGHVVVEDVRRMRHRHAAGLGGRDVDAVVADSHHGNDLERRQPRDQFARHAGVAAAGDRADPWCDAGEPGVVQLVQPVVDMEAGLQLRQQRGRRLRHRQDVDLRHVS